MADDVLDIDEELAGAPAQERDWKGIITALMVIIGICLSILTTIVIFAPLSSTGHIHRRKLTPEQLAEFQYPYDKFHISSNGDVIAESHRSFDILKNGKYMTLISKPRAHFNTQSRLSPNGEFVAELTPEKNHGMNKMNTTYRVVIKRNVTYSIYDDKIIEGVQEFAWHPSSQAYAVVKNNKVFFNDRQLSVDSGRFYVDGIFDWIYMEEIFGYMKAMWFSEDGLYLVYASHDDHLVRNTTMRWYNKLERPTDTNFAYPLVGDKHLPKYKLFVTKLDVLTTKQLDFELDDSEFHYLFSVNWLQFENSEKLVVSWTDRYQQKLILTLCDFGTSFCETILEKSVQPKQWINPTQLATMTSYKSHIYFPFPRRIDNDYYQHIAQLDTITGDISFIPYKKSDIISIKGVNSDRIYFTAAEPTPRDRTLWSANIEEDNRDVYRCETCQLPEDCTYQECKFNKNFTNGAIVCLGPGPTRVYYIDLLTSPITIALAQNITSDKPKPLFTYYETMDGIDGKEIDLKMVLPKPIEELEKGVHLPIVLYVYGGPETKHVTHSNTISFWELLVSKLNIALVTVDGRGTMYRGWNHMSSVYGRLGTVEVDDQYRGVQELAKRYSFLDFDNFAVHGWSYGGFMTLRVAQRYDNIKCAISVAPVTNFMYYDATYTERYMGNSSTYVDVSSDVQNFRTTKLLLMHGLFDENVHFANSAHLIEELQNQDIDFDLMIFPSQEHEISDRIRMVNRKMEKFLESCLHSKTDNK